MDGVPPSFEELIGAVGRRDQAQLTAWLAQFSTPEECYCALRALTESLAREPAGSLHEVARWASRQRDQMLGLDLEDRE